MGVNESLDTMANEKSIDANDEKALNFEKQTTQSEYNIYNPSK